MKLEELGERYILNYILKKVDSSSDLMLPPGDDAAALWFNGLLLACVDMLVSETDVPPGMTWQQVGWKAAVSPISDVASKGGRPKYLLLSLGLMPSMEFEEFEELLRGVETAASRYGARIIGGDLNELRTTAVSVSVLGVAQKLMSRFGAKPGDVLATTGLFGKTYAGLNAIFNNRKADRKILEAVYSPEARVEQGVALASSGGVHACVDSSDGLSESLHLLAESSKVGFVVEALPVDPSAEQYCLDNGLNPLDAVFFGGEEYELVFTVRRGWEDVVDNALRKVGGEMHVFGKAVSGQGVYIREGDKLKPVPRTGWQHFNASRKTP
ncbi:MAG: thiamine-phosphate kinase [Candidatus Caldarchaeum sp.]|nr:thiamine-phosphate kinase [Candidatus Caldarchaeum sp.]MDW7977722.1 thiamine-phosphate kinase [Candidatus Caldarchaeum sp.]MDW8360492.1 thiamine-phosphate kinase [Candidatus Caldarchaeum sp.]